MGRIILPRRQLLMPASAALDYDPYWVNYAYLLHGIGVEGSTNIVDSSGEQWTRTGNTHISTARSVYGGSSIYFDGGGDALYTSAARDNYFPESSPFTISVWVCPEWVGSVGGGEARQIASCRETSSAADGWVLQLNSAGVLNFYGYRAPGTIGVNIGGTTPLIPSQFYHCEVSRDETGTWRIFLDGQLENTLVESGPIGYNGERLRLASHPNSTQRNFKGWMQDFRLVKGQAVHTESFTPPTEPYTDGRVVVLHRLSGLNNGTTFTDLAGRIWTRTGNIKTVTDTAAFGDSSAYCDGSSDYIHTPHDKALNIDEEDSLTLEIYYRYSATAKRSMSKKTSNTAGFWMAVNSTPSVTFGAYAAGGNSLGLGGFSSALNPPNTWACAALVYDKDMLEWRTYKEGVLVNTIAAHGNVPVQTAGGFSLGADKEHAGSSWLGNLQEFRLTKGVARYLENYVPRYAPCLHRPVPE